MNNRMKALAAAALILLVALSGIVYMIIKHTAAGKAPDRTVVQTPVPAAATGETDSKNGHIIDAGGDQGNSTPEDNAGSENQNPEAQKGALQDKINGLLKNAGGVFSIGIKNLGTGEKIMISPQKMPSASVIKIFIMIEAYNQAKNNQLKLDEKVVLKNSMKVGGTGSLQAAAEGTSKSLKELVELMITESDNTATNMLIDKLHMDSINGTIAKLGCKDTVLQRKMMDTESMKAGRDNFTSVTDLVTVLEKMYKGQCLGTDTDNEMLGIMKRQKSNTKIPKRLPKGTVIAHKTGELEGISNDTGIVFTGNGSYIISIMTKNLKNTAAADNLIADISKLAYDDFSGAGQKKASEATGKYSALKGRTICIDPGHQANPETGKEPVAPRSEVLKDKVSAGTQGVVTKVPEYKLALEVSLELRDRLEACGAKVVMTRVKNDVSLSNAERAEIANNSHGDIFLRIHADGSEDSKIKGISVLFPGEGYIKDANLLSGSKKAAACVLSSLIQATGAKDRGAVQREDITGFNWSKLPVILVEMGFMTNPEEDRQLNDPGYRSKIVSGMVDGLARYFENQ